MTRPKDNLAWHVGAPFSSFEVKLIDIPHMNYFTNNYVNQQYNPKGEVLIIPIYIDFYRFAAEALD